MARNLPTNSWIRRFATFVGIHTNGKVLITHAIPLLGFTCAAAKSAYWMDKEREILKEREGAYQRRLQLVTSRYMECEEAKAFLAKKLGSEYAPAGPHKTTHG